MGCGIGSTNLEIIDIMKKGRVIVSTFDVSFTQIPRECNVKIDTLTKADVLEMHLFQAAD